MDILGIHVGHDAAAVLVRDGRIIADAQEERFVRNKHQLGVPFNAIQYCLQAGEIDIPEVDIVAFSGKNPQRVHAEIFGIDLPSRRKSVWTLASELRRRISGRPAPCHTPPLYLPRFLISDRTQVVFVEHHLAHAASAYYTSGAKGPTLIVTADGAGDGTSLALWRGENRHIETLKRFGTEGSLGWFYSNVTEALGWCHGDGEGKTMGLAAYGDYRECQGVLSAYHPIYENGELVVPHDFGPASDWTQRGVHEWHLEDSIAIRNLIEQYGRENIAAEAQRILEEQMAAIVFPWMKRENTRSLCCAGGVFLNVKLNQRLWSSGRIDTHHIFPNSGDAGCAVGAALYAYFQASRECEVPNISHVYWGPSYSDKFIDGLLKDRGLRARRCRNIAEKVAMYLAQGKIVAWFQGAMESGPRALGNRSILMSPARSENKDIINAKVKFRESFRPFCPSMLAEVADEYLTNHRFESYMIMSFDTKVDARNRIPAVVHVDGTVRPQMVLREVNPLYWQLIAEFGNLTGTPVVLNTSFNIKGEPIICSPREAIRGFFDSGIDALVLGPFLLEK